MARLMLGPKIGTRHLGGASRTPCCWDVGSSEPLRRPALDNLTGLQTGWRTRLGLLALGLIPSGLCPRQERPGGILSDGGSFQGMSLCVSQTGLELTLLSPHLAGTSTRVSEAVVAHRQGKVLCACSTMVELVSAVCGSLVRALPAPRKPLKFLPAVVHVGGLNSFSLKSPTPPPAPDDCRVWYGSFSGIAALGNVVKRGWREGMGASSMDIITRVCSMGSGLGVFGPLTL